MKQFLLSALIVANLVLIFTVNAESKVKTHTDPLYEDSLTVCYGIYPPAVSKDPETGELSGYDIEIIENIAERAGFELEYREESFGNMSLAIQSGLCDLTTGYYAQIARASVVAFSEPLYYEGDAALGLINEDRFETIWDTDQAGITIAVANGESGHNFVKEHFSKAEILVIDVESSDLSRFLLEVESGNADIAIGGKEFIRKYVEANPDSVEELFEDQPFSLNPVGFATHHSNTALLNFLNTSIEYLKVNGIIDAIQKDYEVDLLETNLSFK